jgi:hypothetical protein
MNALSPVAWGYLLCSFAFIAQAENLHADGMGNPTVSRDTDCFFANISAATEVFA